MSRMTSREERRRQRFRFEKIRGWWSFPLTVDVVRAAEYCGNVWKIQVGFLCWHFRILYWPGEIRNYWEDKHG